MTRPQATDTTSDPHDVRNLVALHDLDSSARDDRSFPRVSADDLSARRIVDADWGTGLFADRLAAAGHSTIGMDLSCTLLG